jgi:exopolyphosphatase/guanosine-5'-triphosphate,3'-diphosphate pyrophosphatase
MPFLKPTSELISVFDLGSNSFQLLVARKTSGVLVGVHHDTEYNNVASHVQPDGAISAEGIQLALRAVAHLINRAPEEACKGEVLSMATYAIRTATNGRTLLDTVQRVTGLRTKIISGEEAATLAFVGATAEYPQLHDRRFLVVDIGGGSTELAWGSPGAPSRSLCIHLGITSLVQRLAQMPNTANAALDLLAVFVRRTLETALGDLTQYQADYLVFASGVARVLGRLLVSYGLANPGAPIDARALRELIPKLLSAQSGDLLARGVPPERVNTVGPTAVVLEVIRDLFDHELFWVAQGGLREGAALMPEMVGLQPWPR